MYRVVSPLGQVISYVISFYWYMMFSKAGIIMHVLHMRKESR